MILKRENLINNFSFSEMLFSRQTSEIKKLLPGREYFFYFIIIRDKHGGNHVYSNQVKKFEMKGSSL